MSKVRVKKRKASQEKKIRGRTLGLNIRKTWIRVLADNGRNGKTTDKEIQAFMRKEFPGRDAGDFTSPTGVAAVRAAYNRGVYTGGKVPSPLSVAYDDSGKPDVSNRGGSKRLRIKRGRSSGKKTVASKKVA